MSDDLFELAVAPAPTAASYTMTVTQLSGTTLEIDFTGITGRDPAATGDFVALWQAQVGVPWGTSPCNTQNIENTSSDGSDLFGGLSMARLPYVVAYSVGSDTSCHSVTAVRPLGVGGISGPLQSITVRPSAIGSTSLAIDYTAPYGMTPYSFGHRVVLVAGELFLPQSKVIATALPTDNTNDTAAFNNIPLVVGQSYTAAYLAGPTAANVAATTSFTVTAPPI
ncbi:MAG: hypothetical protein JO046_18450 [Solirubrobacterales bacterium]|nr:hypothetical protein [Solirubrobacterales bacterium]